MIHRNCCGVNFVSAPKGQRPSAQGCRASGYPGNRYFQQVSTPTGLRPRSFATLLGLMNISHSKPRVGALHQPWAGGLSPVGAVKKNLGKDMPRCMSLNALTYGGRPSWPPNFVGRDAQCCVFKVQMAFSLSPVANLIEN